MTNNGNNNPWAGLASYEDPAKSERKLEFCGRDNDIYDVTRLIDDNLLLILYGKSGIGKTSLLNAGVFPKLRLDQYLPISIRLGTLEANASYQEAIISAIENAIDEVQGSITIFNVVEEQTENQQPNRLWNFFARHRFNNAKQQPLFPVVVLDQFEEVLRNASPEHVDKAQVLLNQLQYLIDESHALNDCIVDEQKYFYDFNFRFVISIREDELYLLEDNIDDLSLSMFRNCRYRLRSLSQKGAEAAIRIPGKDCIEKDQMDAVVQKIIELSTRSIDEGIDSLLLSLVCTGTFNKKVGDKITSSDLKVWKKGNLMEDYFRNTIVGLGEEKVQFILKHLIHEDGSRKRVDIEEAKRKLGDDFNALTKGKNRMLALGDHDQVELLHDMLAKAVFEERKALERSKKIGTALYAGFVTFFILACLVFPFTQKSENTNWIATNSQALYYVEKSKNLYDKDERLAHLLLLEAFPKYINNSVAEAEQTLRLFTKNDNSIVPIQDSTADFNNKMFDTTNKECSVIINSVFVGNYILRIKSFVSVDTISLDTNNIILIYYYDYYKSGFPNKEITPSIQIKNPQKGSITSIAIKSDGSQFVSASSDSTIIVWDIIYRGFWDTKISNTKILDTIKGHKGGVNSAFYSPDGRYIVSASNDSTVKVWRANEGLKFYPFKEIYTFTGHHGRVLHAEFTDNIHIVSSSDDGAILKWDFPPLDTLIDTLIEQTKNPQLTPEERRMYYLE